MSRRLMPRAAPLLKFLFAAAVIGWMARSGKLELSRVAGTLTHWPVLVTIAAVVACQFALTAWRWRLLLGAQGLRLSFSRAFGLTMIGSLFNLVIPSSVGGDVLKGYYVSKLAGERKAEAVATILLDRAVGLLALVMLAALAGLASFSVMWSSSTLRVLWAFAALASAGGVLALAAVLAFGRRLAASGRSGRLMAVLARILAGFDRYRARPASLPLAVGVSVASHFLACCSIYLATTALGVNISPRLLFIGAPLALMATAVPLAPAGIGVGQAAFYSLFGTAGANAFTVYQSILLLMYTGGLYYYVSYKETAAEAALAGAAQR